MTRARTSQSAELRRNRRQAVDRLVKGQLVSSGAAIKICDISPGGFAMESSSPVRTGEVLAVRFTTRGGSSFIVRATATHNRRVLRSTGPACYVVGLEFAAQQTPTGLQAIKGLLETVNQALSFPKTLSG
ncbi:MAG TPA: PilZ domain-containing protein [Vicinamibacterales bacterium]